MNIRNRKDMKYNGIKLNYLIWSLDILKDYIYKSNLVWAKIRSNWNEAYQCFQVERSQPIRSAPRCSRSSSFFSCFSSSASSFYFLSSLSASSSSFVLCLFFVIFFIFCLVFPPVLWLSFVLMSFIFFLYLWAPSRY